MSRPRGREPHSAAAGQAAARSSAGPAQACPSAGQAGAHAVVIGASMAGLATAAALAERFDRVTVVDRDRLPDDVAHRKGVPQGRHLHLLLPAGASALEELLPGVLDEMVAAGAASGDADRVRLSLGGHRLLPAHPTGHPAVFASRPFVEAHVRRRVRDHPAVRLCDARAVRGLVANADRRRVTGVRLSAPDGPCEEQTLPADLVVDCSGRGSRTPAWLAELGCEPARVDALRVEVRYATQTLRLPSDVLGGDRHVLVGPTPHGPLGGAMTQVGRDEWMVTLFAMGGGVAPVDSAEFRRFARHLPVPDIHEALRDGEPVDEPAGFRFPANLRHRYERLTAFPQGLLVAGDAVCSFNPIYGQGMSVAAIEAVRLRRLLREGPVPAPQAWFEAITPTVQAAWALATGADLAVEAVAGRRTLAARAANRYLRGLHAAAARDSDLTTRFARVAGLLDPPRALLRPAAVARVLRGTLRPPVAR